MGLLGLYAMMAVQMSTRSAMLNALLDEPSVVRARDFGIDVSLTIRNMLMSPEDRWRLAISAMKQVSRLRGVAANGAVRDAEPRHGD